MLRRLCIFALVIILVLSLTACAPKLPPPVSHGGPVRDYVSFIDNLRAKGATVEPVGEVEQPFFTVKGNVIKVNSEDVQVFEFSSADTAKKEADTVGPDGSSFPTIMITWIAPPHFYRTEKIIVLYVGDTQAIKDLLESLLGKQFAGR